MEHGNNRQDDVRFTHSNRVGNHGAHGVQVGTAMAIHHTLRVSSGTRRVTHSGRLVFVNVGGPLCGLRICKQRFIFMHGVTRN